MPLRCLHGDAEIFAFDVESDEDWESLRRLNSSSKELRMACCGAHVVLRISPLGTRFFAHARKGPCETALESAEHLLAKRHIVDGIKQTNWIPKPEQSGVSPDGEEWRADVIAERGQRKVAFEVQWSRQAHDETRRRQERYTNSGVRGLWLFRQAEFFSDQETPAFRLKFDADTNSFAVVMPSPNHSAGHMGRDKDMPMYWSQSVQLPDFVSGALTGRLQFAPAIGKRLPLVVNAAFSDCWSCGEETGIVTGLVFSTSRVMPGAADIYLGLRSFDEDIPNGSAELMKLLPADLLRQHGIGEIKPRYSKRENKRYLSNGCLHCGILQGRFFEHDVTGESVEALTVEAEFKADWASSLPYAKKSIYIWWFDASK